MSTYRFHLGKLKTEWADPIIYSYADEQGDWVIWNEWLGRECRFEYQGEINCVVCGRKTSKAFGEGLCYPCFRDAPEASPCIVRPELCEAHLGKGRDPEWEERHHNQPHVVYLARTSAIKVGITREVQIPTRWIDQGANEAAVIARVPYRQLAGEIEVALKEHLTDKTSWQKMLKNVVTDVGLDEVIPRLPSWLPEALHPYLVGNGEHRQINYPVDRYPGAVSSVKLDKSPDFSGVLTGIRGQYLLFEGGKVLNVRAHSGYHTTIQVL